VRNLIRFAHEEWGTKPEYCILIGKGRKYDSMRGGGAAYNQSLIPSYGLTTAGIGGSDILLATPQGGNIAPLIPIGRISAVNGSDVRAYLDKLKDFELLQNQTGDPYQTIANKLWMKEIMHMSGGITASEQLRFINYLKVYEDSIKSVHYGGNVFTISKTSSDPIQIGLADAIRDRINAGVSVITFFGHSTGNSFDISIDNPANFTNFKRYPVIISNGCFAGEIFDAGRGISGQFIFQENKG